MQKESFRTKIKFIEQERSIVKGPTVIFKETLGPK